jgi:type II secretory ATPase GspE/PulE/Tfp pilus assembly ATPase PilB-like protein
MGIEPYLVASSLEAVVAQRLVRIICPECKEPVPESEIAPLRKRLGDKLPEVLYRGKGCRNCQGSGYRGRRGIFEMMVVTDDIRALILDNASPRDLRRASASQGMTSLREDGFRHLHAGRTTVDEIFRVTKDDSFAESEIGQIVQEL